MKTWPLSLIVLAVFTLSGCAKSDVDEAAKAKNRDGDTVETAEGEGLSKNPFAAGKQFADMA